MDSISLLTAYGPAAYRFRLSPKGKVTEVQCAALELPTPVLKLSFPNVHPEDLEQHLLQWIPVVPYLVELGIWLDQPPEYLVGIRDTFRARCPEYEAYRQEIKRIPMVGETQHSESWWRVQAWSNIGVAELIAGFPLYRDRKKVVFAADKKGLPYRRLAAAWLLQTFPLAPPILIDEWITAIGKTRTTEGNEFLMAELERPGYLTYAKQVYSTLANSRLKLPVERILALYADKDKIQHSVNTYIHLLKQFPFDQTSALLEQIMLDYPQESFSASKRLYRFTPDRTREIIVTSFKTTNNYRTLIAMLRHMTNVVSPSDFFISLADVNQRLAQPRFLDKTQVTWPQKLDAPWREILLATTPEDFISILETYLPKARGRLARNLVMQLKEYLLSGPVKDFQLPQELIPPLLELLNSRYDKVSTVATDVIRLLLPHMASPELANAALLQHIERSSYRMMDAAALKVAAENPSLRDAQIAYFKERFAEDNTEEQQLTLRKIMTYLRHLPDWREL